MELRIGFDSIEFSRAKLIPLISSKSISSSRNVSKLNTLTWFGLSPSPTTNPSLIMYSGGSSINDLSLPGSVPIPNASVANALAMLS